VLLIRRFEGFLLFDTGTALMYHGAEIWCKALDLFAPVAKYGCWRDDESWWQDSVDPLTLFEQAGDDL
jgi:hypothetical protein